MIAQTLVQIGTAGQGLAIGWEIYTRTNNAFLLGLVGLAQAVPMLLFTLPGRLPGRHLRPPPADPPQHAGHEPG